MHNAVEERDDGEVLHCPTAQRNKTTLYEKKSEDTAHEEQALLSAAQSGRR